MPDENESLSEGVSDVLDYQVKMDLALVMWRSKVADLLAIRERVTGYGKGRFSLFEAKYKNAKEILLELGALKENILLCGLKLKQSPQLDLDWKNVHDDMETIEVLYAEALDAERALDRPTAGPPAPRPSSAAHRPPPTPANHSGMRVPSITVPPFTNDVRDWPKFLRMFNCVYGNNESLSEDAKCFYLHSLLTGEALDLVSEFSDTQHGFQSSLAALKATYASPRALASLHMTDLLHFTPIKKATSANLRQFLSVYQHHVTSLKNMHLPNLLDYVFVEMGLRSLDGLTRKLFENSLAPGTMPTHTQLIEFVRKQALMQDILEKEQEGGVSHAGTTPAPKSDGKFGKPRTFQVRNDTREEKRGKNPPLPPQCRFCRSYAHKIYACDGYLNLPPAGRLDWVKRNSMCVGCLAQSHRIDNCKSKQQCKFCGSREHHSTLHENAPGPSGPPAQTFYSAQAPPQAPPGQWFNPLLYYPPVVPSMPPPMQAPPPPNGPNLSAPPGPPNPPKDPTPPRAMACNAPYPSVDKQVLLGTLVAVATDSAGCSHFVRCVLDSGSQRNLLSLQTARRLNLRIDRNVATTLSGVSDVATRTLGKADLTLKSRFGQFSLNISCLVLPTITGALPSVALPHSVIEQFKKVSLADPDFGIPGPADILLNSEMFMQIVIGVTPPGNYPRTVDTHFGHVVMGEVPSPRNDSLCFLNLEQKESNLLDVMEKFWELEEISTPTNPPQTFEENFVENHFLSTYKREPDGRFIVELPFDPAAPPLGSNRNTAYASCHALETRLKKNPVTYDKYRAVMEAALSDGSLCITNVNNPYVITHHVVFKKDSQKARVVYNASAPSNTGVSLNQTLLAGPALQRDLGLVLMGFRIPQIALTSDISSMFTNVGLGAESSEKLHIFLRKDRNDQRVQEAKMTSVPFGLKCSPYLAIRCLLVLAEEGKENFPLAANAILRQTYVDNFLCGADSYEDCMVLREQLIALLAQGRFPLSQFASSNPMVLSGLPEPVLDKDIVFSSGNEGIKVLGLIWKSSSDHFTYKATAFSGPCTKRNILSYCGSLFDPNGLVNPVVLSMKLFIQSLWSVQLEWDEEIPPDRKEKWLSLVESVPQLAGCVIPRCISPPNCTYWLAIFCDGSKVAYGTCMYLIWRDSNGQTSSTLLAAKSKVSPLKVKMTIPQTELSAMLLGAKLLEWFYAGKFPIKIEDVYFFSDSQVCLAWLKNPPVRSGNVFVYNRVSKVNAMTKGYEWHYVPTAHNPSDLVSRGMAARDILNNTFWFHGPLSLFDAFPPKAEGRPTPYVPAALLAAPETEFELKAPATLAATVQPPSELLEKFSDFSRLVRVTSYLLRFAHNCRKAAPRRSGPLTVKEMDLALNTLVRVQQEVAFPEDLARIRRGEQCTPALISLTPFLDDDGILRVGGRLGNSLLSFSAQHPILMPKKGPLTVLICRKYHAISGHAGPDLTLSLIRQKYWPIHGRSLLRSLTSACVQCRRLNAAKCRQPIQGDLPPARAQPAPPFRGTVGLDAAGPFKIRLPRKTRQSANTEAKGYLILFVCLSTRAVHLEFMSDMSADAFLAAFDRMVSRRGAPRRCNSDMGTNFVKSARVLCEFSQFLDANKNELLSQLASRSIEWNFLPPYSPDKGGIWERQIGAAKRILKGLIGDEPLFFEEYNTVFCKVEALLNSRPYFPVSASSADPMDILTPAHFLIHSGFAPLPECPVDEKVGIRKRWDHLRAITQGFWKRWSREYLQTRMARDKWPRATPNLTVGQLVLVPDAQTTPACWPLGLVESVFQGSQGAVRIVDVRTRSGVLRRSANKLVVVPVHA